MERSYSIPHKENDQDHIHQQEMLRRNPLRIIKPGDPDFERTAQEIMENQQNDKKTPPSKKSSTKKLVACKSCGREMRIIGRGLCGNCYNAEKEAGTLEENYPSSKRKNAAEPIVCSECGKTKPMLARGMCRDCYNRINYHKNKKPTNSDKQRKTGTTGTCLSCKRQKTIMSRGLCSGCYSKHRNAGTLDEVALPPKSPVNNMKNIAKKSGAQRVEQAKQSLRQKIKSTATEPKPDAVNHPIHYTGHPSGIECIDITEHMNFCTGNAIKYIWRAGQKGDPIQDLEKALWYIRREIKRMKEHQA